MDFVTVAIVSAIVLGYPIQQKSRILIGLNCIRLCLNTSSQIAKNRKVRQASSKNIERRWSKKDLPEDDLNFTRPGQRVITETKNAHPVTFFEDFFDAPVLDYVCEQSMLYSAFKGNSRFKPTK